MKQALKPLMLVVIAAFVSAAILSSTAFAEEAGLPSILPTPTTGSPLTFTSESSTEGSYRGAEEFKWQKLTDEGSFTSQRLGTAKLKFTGATTVRGGVKCKSKEATVAGEVVVFTDAHLVDLEIEGNLELGVAFTLLGETKEDATKSIVFTCGVIKAEVKGTVIGSVDKSNSSEPLVSLEKITKILVLFKEAGGKQAIKTCHLTKEFCEGKTYEILGSLGGAFTESVLVGNDGVTFATEVESHF